MVRTPLHPSHANGKVILRELVKPSSQCNEMFKLLRWEFCLSSQIHTNMTWSSGSLAPQAANVTITVVVKGPYEESSAWWTVVALWVLVGWTVCWIVGSVQLCLLNTERAPESIQSHLSEESSQRYSQCHSISFRVKEWVQTYLTKTKITKLVWGGAGLECRGNNHCRDSSNCGLKSPSGF